MPLLHTAYPQVLNSFYGPSPPDRPFLIYYASIDPATGEMWCPDCRAVQSTVKEAFLPADGPTGLIIWVGQRAEWKDPNNKYRKEAGIESVPTIVKLKAGKEVARIVMYDILDKEKLDAFMKEE